MTAKKSNKSAVKSTARQNKSAPKKMKSVNLTVKATNTPFGSYNVQTGASFKTQVPSAYGQVDSLAGPSQSYDSQGNCRVKHREYIKDIFSTNPDYELLHEFIANPTIVQDFPWLSGMATNFQKFCFERLCLHFVTQSPTTTPGSVMIVPIYDVDQDTPEDKSSALTFQDTVRSPAWQECCALLPRKRLCGYKDYFTKIEADDQKLSIPAKVILASSGASDSSPVTGELWVEYDIRLTCPQRATETFSFAYQKPGADYNLLVQETVSNMKKSIVEIDGTSVAIEKPKGSYLVDLLWNNVTNANTFNVDLSVFEDSTLLVNLESSSSPAVQGWRKALWRVDKPTGILTITSLNTISAGNSMAEMCDTFLDIVEVKPSFTFS